MLRWAAQCHNRRESYFITFAIAINIVGFNILSGSKIGLDQNHLFTMLVTINPTTTICLLMRTQCLFGTCLNSASVARSIRENQGQSLRKQWFHYYCLVFTAKIHLLEEFNTMKTELITVWIANQILINSQFKWYYFLCYDCLIKLCLPI